MVSYGIPGYVCQLLNHLYGYKILGLDSSRTNIEKAKLRQRIQFPDSLLTVKYVCANITEGSVEFIQSTLKTELKERRKVCLIGLHACGNLSVSITKMYVEMEIARLLVLVPCCYHKLSLTGIHKRSSHDNKIYFEYFPVSNALKNAVGFMDVDNPLKRPFMRLASQETSDRWFTVDKESHDKHSLYVLARAVLELYADENKIGFRKLVRKGTRKSQSSNFISYLKDFRLRHSYERIFCHGESSETEFTWTHDAEHSILTMWNRYVSKLKSIEAYTALQMILQITAESLVLTDRCCYLEQQNCNATLLPITTRSVSPRCFALISNKI